MSRRSRKDELIYLITYTFAKNGSGDSIRTPVKRPVLAEEKSIRQSEHHQAAANGLKLERTFVIWRLEYSFEAELEHEDTLYTIERTFNIDDKEMELICSGLVGTRSAEEVDPDE